MVDKTPTDSDNNSENSPIDNSEESDNGLDEETMRIIYAHTENSEYNEDNDKFLEVSQKKKKKRVKQQKKKRNVITRIQ